MQPRFGHVPPSKSGSIMATLSPASRVATVTPIPALPPPMITTSKLCVGIPLCSLRADAIGWPGRTCAVQTPGLPRRLTSRSNRYSPDAPGFLLQRAYHVPAADILLAAAGAVDDWSAEREIRVVDRFGTPGGDCLQPLGVEIGPGRLTIPVERVKEANMRRDEPRRANDVAQPLAEFAQLRAVFDLDEDGPERCNSRARYRAPRHS